MQMLEGFQRHLTVPFFLFFCFFFPQLRLGSQSTYNMYCRSSTFVCVGQRLVRARVVLSSILGLVSIKLSEILPSDTYSLGAFFYPGYSFFFRHLFLRPELTLDLMKQTLFSTTRRSKKLKTKTRKNDTTSDTYV